MHPAPPAQPGHVRNFEFAVCQLRLAIAKYRVGRTIEKIRRHLDAAGRRPRRRGFPHFTAPSMN
jgi:hypothetical protein